ncbi:hypothetical protein Tco_0463137 [Tanacetum coccineum]
MPISIKSTLLTVFHGIVGEFFISSPTSNSPDWSSCSLRSISSPCTINQGSCPFLNNGLPIINGELRSGPHSQLPKSLESRRQCAGGRECIILLHAKASEAQLEVESGRFPKKISLNFKLKAFPTVLVLVQMILFVGLATVLHGRDNRGWWSDLVWPSGGRRGNRNFHVLKFDCGACRGGEAEKLEIDVCSWSRSRAIKPYLSIPATSGDFTPRGIVKCNQVGEALRIMMWTCLGEAEDL